MPSNAVSIVIGEMPKRTETCYSAFRRFNPDIQLDIIAGDRIYELAKSCSKHYDVNIDNVNDNRILSDWIRYYLLATGQYQYWIDWDFEPLRSVAIPDGSDCIWYAGVQDVWPEYCFIGIGSGVDMRIFDMDVNRYGKIYGASLIDRFIQITRLKFNIIPQSWFIHIK